MCGLDEWGGEGGGGVVVSDFFFDTESIFF